MINFMSEIYNDYRLHVTISDDWVVLGHVDKYKTLLSNIELFMQNQLKNLDSKSASDCDFDTSIWEMIFEEYGFPEDEKTPLSSLISDLSKEIVECSTCQYGSNNPRTTYDPVLDKVDGIFVKLIDALDKGAGNFLQNYSMAKQLEKYVCDFMVMFRQVIEIQDAIKYGIIMGYFDKIYKELDKAFNDFMNYMYYNDIENSTDLDCTFKKNFTKAYYSPFVVPDLGQLDRTSDPVPAFIVSLDNYKSQLKIGLTDLNEFLDAIDGFFDEIYVSIKSLGALNIVFYADPSDHDMLQKESSSTFDTLAPLVGSDTSSTEYKMQLQGRTVRAMAMAIPIAIEAQKYIDDTRSNQDVIFSSAVNALFTNIGTEDKLNDLRYVLDQQHN